MKISPILRRAGAMLIFKCPGCCRNHGIRIRALSSPGDRNGPGWEWDGDAERPTFSPSVLVRYDGADAGIGGAPPAVCHSFVRDGQIEFLADCTHGLAGQTVPLLPWPDEEPA
jgi:hypothetical protein